MSGKPWDQICMELALDLASKSKCRTPDREIGCVIVNSDYTSVLSWGYNGGPRGLDHHCKYSPSNSGNGGSRCSCAHAEANALIKLDYTNQNKKIMYVTLSPCENCAILIINARIDKVVYLQEYRDPGPIFMLRSAGIEVEQYSGAIDENF